MRWSQTVAATNGALLFVLGTADMGRAINLTGITLFSADSAGNVSGGHYWNTMPWDISYNLWVGQGSVETPTWISGPTDFWAGINHPLNLGTQTFNIYGEPGADTGYVGLNLFFDREVFTPRISVLLPTNVNSPAMAANWGSTFAMTIVPVWGAGTLSFTTAENQRITLTSASWQTQATGLDLVAPHTIGRSGASDFIGQFSLTVGSAGSALRVAPARSTIPESSPVAGLLALGLLGLGTQITRRHTKRSE